MKRLQSNSRSADKSLSLGRKTQSTPPDDALASLSENSSVSEIRAAIASNGRVELEERVKDTRDSWETESLFQDVIEEMANEESENGVAGDDVDACTPLEATNLRYELRQIGPAAFCRKVDEGLYTSKKLLTAFGMRPPLWMEGRPDEAYDNLLKLAISRELSKRIKLMRYNTVSDAVELIRRSQNIIVLTGAGISTSLGIPDFRSSKTGLYAQLEKRGLAVSDPQEVFDISQFRLDPTIFFSVAKNILPATTQYTPTHRFIAMLQEHGKLLTNYTQNIDNLEAYAGIDPDRLIQCHGSFATATCQQCGHKVKGDSIFPEIKAGLIPRCSRCLQNLRVSGRSVKRKRSAGGTSRRQRRFSTDDSTSESDYDIPQAGIMKPDITFFGESLPDEFERRLTEHDRDLVDLVIVIGTSLKVTPVSEIVSWLPPKVPAIYISRQAVGHINFDIDLLGDCDTVVTGLCRQLGWDLDHEMVDPTRHIEIDKEPGYMSRYRFSLMDPES